MKYAKPIAFVVLIAALVIAGIASGWAGWFVDGSFAALLAELVNQNVVVAAIVYCAASIVGCVVLALPGVLFALAAGALFGPIWGTLLCWFSMWVGACASFCVGRYFLKDALKPKLEKSPALNKLLFEGARKSDVFLLAITRLVPLFPFNVQNFAYGITDVSFTAYAVYSGLFMLPGTAAYTFVAAGALDPDNRVACLAVAAVLIALSIGVAFLLKKKAGLS